MTVTFDRETKRVYNRLWAKAKQIGPEAVDLFKRDWKAGSVSLADHMGYEARLDAARKREGNGPTRLPEKPAPAPADEEVELLRRIYSDEVAEHFRADKALTAGPRPKEGTDEYRAYDAARKRVANRRKKIEAAEANARASA